MKGISFLLAVIVITSCTSRISRQISDVEKKFKDETGFILYDPAAKKTLSEFHSAHYFAPASNTKILTLYTALRLLGDSIPALKYIIKNDSLIFWGTGDPSFLNGNVFNNGKIYRFLQNSPQRLFVTGANFRTNAYGPGWAWDDFSFAYSAERAPFPLYGNTQEIRKIGNRFAWSPAWFQTHFVVGDSIAGSSKMSREIDSNEITYFPGKKSTANDRWIVPYHWSSDVFAEMLSDTLKRQVDEINWPARSGSKTIYSVPADSLYAVMMKQSDNFIAEQLLLLCSENLSDTLDTQIAIRYAKKNFLGDFQDEITWTDGSGLSRYNMQTPRNIAALWAKLYAEFPKDRLFGLLATGGQPGTLKGNYATNPPFIFGKSGSFSNNLALSGYLITKKGKVLIFCFMNSNFVAPGREIRTAMEQILTGIRDKY